MLVAAVTSYSVFAFGGKKSTAEPEAAAASSPATSASSAPAAVSAASSSTEETIWVTKSDGSKSCGAKKGIPLEAGKKALTQAGVRVITASKGNDGKVYIQSCGAPTGKVNAYKIPKADLQRASELGYKEAEKGFSKE